MITLSWLYGAMICMYALSLLFYFSDFIGWNRNAKRMGTGLLAFVWSIQLVYLAVSFGDDRHIPLFARFESLVLFSCLLVMLSLFMSFMNRMEFLVFFMNIAGFAVLLLNCFSNRRVGVPLYHGEASVGLLYVHGALAVGSYVSYTVSAIFSGMYLFMHRKLKEGQWSSFLRRASSLERMHDSTGTAVRIGTGLLMLSIAFGFASLLVEGRPSALLDLKVVVSILVLLAYTAYLVRRHSMQVSGDRLALWNLLLYGAVVANYTIANFLSAFHQWTGSAAGI